MPKAFRVVGWLSINVWVSENVLFTHQYITVAAGKFHATGIIIAAREYLLLLLLLLLLLCSFTPTGTDVCE